jgi:hypothetical protein
LEYGRESWALKKKAHVQATETKLLVGNQEMYLALIVHADGRIILK